MPGGKSSIERIPFFKAKTRGLPLSLEGIICTSDLQGVPSGQEETTALKMLGEVVAEELFVLAELGQIPEPKQLGVVLAGDLYAFPEAAERGGKGDVRAVWKAFRDRYRWVAGVAGNHDQFGEGNLEPDQFKAEKGILYLDGDERKIDGLKLAGIGGIIGRPTKPFRRTEEDFVATLQRLLVGNPDLLILHEAPEIRESGYIGSTPVRQILDRGPAGLVVCGHKEWPEPLVELPNGVQILNLDFRVVLLLPSDRGKNA